MALSYRTGILTGVGLSLVAAFMLPRWGRPATKATIKGGMAAYESASETLARLREILSDISAEATFERAAEHASASEAERAAAAPRRAERQERDEAQPSAAS
jgi:hypothetical protein